MSSSKNENSSEYDDSEPASPLTPPLDNDLVDLLSERNFEKAEQHSLSTFRELDQSCHRYRKKIKTFHRWVQSKLRSGNVKQESGTYEMLAVLHFNMVEFRSQLKSHREKIRDLADQSFLFFDVLRRIPNRIRNPVETRDQGTQCPDALDLVNEKKYSILPMHGLDFTLNQPFQCVQEPKIEIKQLVENSEFATKKEEDDLQDDIALEELGIGEHFSLYEYSEFYTEKKFRKLDKLRNWKLEEKLDSTAVESSKDQQSCSYWHNEPKIHEIKKATMPDDFSNFHVEHNHINISGGFQASEDIDDNFIFRHIKPNILNVDVKDHDKKVFKNIDKSDIDIINNKYAENISKKDSGDAYKSKSDSNVEFVSSCRPKFTRMPDSGVVLSDSETEEKIDNQDILDIGIDLQMSFSSEDEELEYPTKSVRIQSGQIKNPLKRVRIQSDQTKNPPKRVRIQSNVTKMEEVKDPHKIYRKDQIEEDDSDWNKPREFGKVQAAAASIDVQEVVEDIPADSAGIVNNHQHTVAEPVEKPTSTNRANVNPEIKLPDIRPGEYRFILIRPEVFQVMYRRLNFELVSFEAPQLAGTGMPRISLKDIQFIMPEVSCVGFTLGPQFLKEFKKSAVNIDLTQEYSFVSAATLREECPQKSIPWHLFQLRWGGCKYIKTNSMVDVSFRLGNRGSVLQFSAYVVQLDLNRHFDCHRIIIGTEVLKQSLISANRTEDSGRVVFQGDDGSFYHTTYERKRSRN